MNYRKIKMCYSTSNPSKNSSKRNPTPHLRPLNPKYRKRKTQKSQRRRSLRRRNGRSEQSRQSFVLTLLGVGRRVRSLEERNETLRKSKRPKHTYTRRRKRLWMSQKSYNPS